MKKTLRKNSFKDNTPKYQCILTLVHHILIAKKVFKGQGVVDVPGRVRQWRSFPADFFSEKLVPHLRRLVPSQGLSDRQPKYARLDPWCNWLACQSSDIGGMARTDKFCAN